MADQAPAVSAMRVTSGPGAGTALHVDDRSYSRTLQRWMVQILALATALLAACPPEPEPEPSGPFHDPWTVMPSSEMSQIRGWQIKRGIVHSHSTYSHDACDGEPFVDGVRNEACYQGCRRGMCETRQDFVFLTDHDDLFAQYEFPEVLLFQEGDSLIERAGTPVANRVDCGDGHSVIIGAGTETEMMPIGLERHVGVSVADREAAYGEVSEEAVRDLQEAGALVFLQHTEGWPLETILTLPIDGIEVYNLHQNMMDRMGDVVTMVLERVAGYKDLPVPELSLIAVFEESEADLFRWSHAVLQQRMPAVLATDAHQNVFNDETDDGERLDSFRRMMHWFSNYVLVDAGQQPDDRTVKQAIAEGRFFSAFDYLGYPVGFDFFARVDDAVFEMGAATPAGQAATLHVQIPTLYRFDPRGPKPRVSARILRAEAGSWIEVATTDGAIDSEVEAGVYRVEVRMVPEHLAPWLGTRPERFIRELIWVYSQPIYVGRQ